MKACTKEKSKHPNRSPQKGTFWLRLYNLRKCFREETSVDLPVCPQNWHFRGGTSDGLPVCPQNRRFRGESSSESSSETSIGLAVGCGGIKKEPTENQ